MVAYILVLLLQFPPACIKYHLLKQNVSSMEELRHILLDNVISTNNGSTYPGFEVDFVSGIMEQLDMCLIIATSYRVVQCL